MKTQEIKTYSIEHRDVLAEEKRILFLNAEIEYHKRFLELTGLKIGDIVNAYFSVSSGNSKNSYMSGGYHPAIIKQHENGVLYLESTEKISQSRNVSNGRSGRDRKDWWEYDMVIKIAEIKDIKIN